MLRVKGKGSDTMKSSIMIRCSSLLLILFMIVWILPASVTAAQPPVNLGTAAGFAVLAGTPVPALEAVTTTAEAKTVAETTRPVTKTGEPGDILVIVLIMLGLAGCTLAALNKSRWKGRTVTLNRDYRVPNRKK